MDDDNRAFKPSILVVDDEVDTCQNLADILEDWGYRVDTAHDGPSALKLVEQKCYSVALLDLKMPGMDGVTLYREIKKRQAGTVAIIVTAYATSETKEEALQAGAAQVLAKPVDVEKLLMLVGEAAGQPLVLIVDDDHDLCASLQDVLRERGFRACMAHNARNAVEKLANAPFQVVLIDMKLPEGDGSRVFRKVRESNPRTRTVLITGYRSEMERLVDRTLEEGADAACYKPFDVPVLLETIERLAGGNEGPA